MKFLLFLLACLPAFGAISPGAPVNCGTAATEIICAYTISGSNIIMFINIDADLVSADASCTHVSSVTYNSVAATLIAKVAPTGGRCVYGYYLVGASPGTANIDIKSTSANSLGAHAMYYTGAASVGQLDNSTSQVALTGTNLTTSLTTVANNCWVVYMGSNVSGSNLAGAGMTMREGAGGFTASFIGDNNGAKTPPGSVSENVSQAGGTSTIWGVVMASIVPSASSSGSIKHKVITN